MKHVSDFPRKVRVIDDLWITLGDGCRLSARLWLPEDADSDPVPLILEHLPYRKRDGTIERDEFNHPWMAGQGYAVLRTDMRGNGESEGLMSDEYTPQELQDALDIFNWAEQQKWCTGNCGMMGISWGGFNALQVAALNPRQLKAIITVCSTVDRYGDDIHYKGGCLMTENFGWAVNMLAYSSRPPDPAIVGDERWLAMWRERLEAMPFLIDTWLDHQHRDAYWKHGSVCEDYSAIKAAVLSMGGWHDGYRNTVAHLVENLQAPVKGIVGPWNHKYGNYGGPGPTIGFLQEAKRWWDRYLKFIDNGIEKDPAYRAYLMDAITPRRNIDFRPGRWIAETNWPSKTIRQLACYLATDTANNELKLRYEKKPMEAVAVNSAQHCGAMGGVYFPFAFGDEHSDEQFADDALSACFDSEPVFGAMDIVGAPQVTLKVLPQADTGLVMVRLCDVFEDGTSAHITTGYLNLCHHASHEFPRKLIPGEPIEVSFALDQIAYRLPNGHRLRLAISSAGWPMVWPSISGKGFSVLEGRVEIPLRAVAMAEEWQFEESIGSPLWEAQTLRESSYVRKQGLDAESGEYVIRINSDFGEKHDKHHGLDSGGKMKATWSIKPDDPLSARGEIWWMMSGGREGARWETLVMASIDCDGEYFNYRADLTALHNGREFFRKQYDNRRKRDLV